MKEIDPDVILAMDTFMLKERLAANKSDCRKFSMSSGWSDCKRSFQLSGKEELLDIVELLIDGCYIMAIEVPSKWTGTEEVNTRREFHKKIVEQTNNHAIKF